MRVVLVQPLLLAWKQSLRKNRWGAWVRSKDSAKPACLFGEWDHRVLPGNFWWGPIPGSVLLSRYRSDPEFHRRFHDVGNPSKIRLFSVEI